jgi:hypothetical protein
LYGCIIDTPPGIAKAAVKQTRLRAAKAAAEQDAVKQTLREAAQTFVIQIRPGTAKVAI